MPRTVVAGAIGNCVHVAGVVQFLRIAEELGYKTHFLGAAVSVDAFVKAVKALDTDLVGVSFRLTPEVGEKLLGEFKNRIFQEGLSHRRFVFAGTPPVCRAAEKSGLFERCFTGLENIQDVRRFLSGKEDHSENEMNTGGLLERIKTSYPYPLLRHHFGLPDMGATIEGVREIASSGILDIISLAPDQNAQESFFRPGEMDPLLDGAGGVPVRTPKDLKRIYEASITGSRPLLRVYSGTRDLIPWAELASQTLHNAWGAIPLCWYNVLDGRSGRLPEESIRENQQAMCWYGKNGIPLEVNEAHHWSLRDAHDTIAVVMGYLAAYNAKALGVKSYISQYMFNTPPMTYPVMDLAKMLAKIKLIESLHDENFTTFRQARAGILHLSPRLNLAKGQLAASTGLALAVKPHIIHVVGFCEGDHAAEADDVIESCEIAHGVLKNSLAGMPETVSDPLVTARRDELLLEAEVLIDAIKELGKGCEDPLTSPRVLAEAIRRGIIDAPHLKGNAYAAGKLETRCVNGAIFAWDKENKKVLTEQERLAKI